MQLSTVREIVSDFKESFKKEHFFSFFSSHPHFIKNIELVFNCKDDPSFEDRDITPAEEIILARILTRAKRDEEDCWENRRAQSALVRQLRPLGYHSISGDDFIETVEFFSEKGLLQEFGATLVANKGRACGIISYLKERHTDTEAHIRLCLQYLNRMPAAGTVISALVQFNPALLTAEHMNRILAITDHSDRLVDLCNDLKDLSQQLIPEARTADYLARYLASATYPYPRLRLQEVVETLRRADPALPAFALPGSAIPEQISASIALAYRIVSLTPSTSLATAVIVKLASLRVLDAPVFAQYAVRAILEAHQYSKDLPKILGSYSVDHLASSGPVGDEDNTFLKKLLDLREGSAASQLARSIHAANPGLLEDNMDRIQTITQHSAALCSAIRALRRQRQITQEDLDFLFDNASNVVIAAMRRGALFERTDPVIVAIFTNLQTLSALKRHKKTPPPHAVVAGVASSLGLSGETLFLIDGKPQAETEARRAFFSSHIVRPAPIPLPVFVSVPVPVPVPTAESHRVQVAFHRHTPPPPPAAQPRVVPVTTYREVTPHGPFGVPSIDRMITLQPHYVRETRLYRF
ncbi:MAG: hypothetical protein NTV32_01025 [Gammaproteobacteria bacterium]|nr:hypothetical protein [Gammaproteobacteria bacterium]